MDLKLDYTNLFKHENMLDGMPYDDFIKAQDLCGKARDLFAKKKATDPLGFYDLPDYEVDHILEYVEKVKDRFDSMVVMGIGGSALGNKAVYSAIQPASRPITSKINTRL